MNKIIRYGLLAIFAILATGSLATTNPAVEIEYENNIPDEVIEWSRKNTFKVLVGEGSGSGFFLSNNLFITACHVVEGRDYAFLVNYRTLRLFNMKVESCNVDTDIAILTRVEGFETDYFTKSTRIAPIPKRGTALYGSGYPLGLPLVITRGHYQFKVEDNPFKEDVHLITTPTLPGDSGSPVIGVENGVVVVYGIRVAIKAMPLGWSGYQLIPYLTLMASGDSILKAIHSDL